MCAHAIFIKKTSWKLWHISSLSLSSNFHVLFIHRFGAALVTLNAQLLGGTISFFQSICILGYCVFPLTLSAFTCMIIGLLYKQILLKLIIVGVGFVWSTRASGTFFNIYAIDSLLEICSLRLYQFTFCVFAVVFMVQVIKEERRALAVFPVFFFYTFIGWLILLQ